MKKSYNPVTDVRNESVEGTRRLYRAITDIARNLDECRNRAQLCVEVFLPAIESQRLKLCDYCERLVFSDPLGFGRKGEELLWRKGYYDVVTIAKRLRKNNVWTKDEEAHLQRHLYAGIGHYHHIIFRLQIDFRLDLRGFVDFPLVVNDGGLMKGKHLSSRCQEEGGIEWAHQAVHRCLVYLGDLSRYLLEVYPQWDSGMPQRYYLQAVSLNADFGMPHNQLGTLSGTLNYNLDAAYYYMRCLSCIHPFDGADGNLRRIFEKNAKWLQNHNRWNLDDKMDEMSPTERIHRFVARFLVVIDVWFFDKTFPANPSQLCQEMVDDLRHCLQYMKQFPSDTQLSPEQMDFDDLINFGKNTDEEKPEYLSDEVVFKLVAMLLLSMSRLHAKRSKLLSGLVVFTLAVISEIIQQVINHMQDSVLTLSLPSHGAPFPSPPFLTPENSDPSSTSNDSSVCTSLLSCPTAPYSDVCVSTPPADSEKKNVALENCIVLPKMNGISETIKFRKKDKRKLKFLSKFRRRRPKAAIHNSSEDSDYSDGDVPYCSSGSSDEGNEDISENDEQLIYDEVDDDSDDSSTSTQVESKDLSSNGSKGNNDNDKDMLMNGHIQTKDDAFREVNGDVYSLNGESVDEDIYINGVTGSSCDSQDDGKKTTDLHSLSPTKNNNVNSKCHMDPADVIELVAGEGLLQIVKVCADWLLGEKEVLKACGRNTPTLLSRIVTLLNLINVDKELIEKCPDSAKFFKLRNMSKIFERVPLTEDVKMKGISLLKEAHSGIDWGFFRNYCLNNKEEAVLRIYKLVEFGKFLARIEELKIVFDEHHSRFSIITEELNERETPVVNGNPASARGGHKGSAVGVGSGTNTPTAESPSAVSSPGAMSPVPTSVLGSGGGGRRDDLMQHMGQLWLRAQVRELESRVQQQRRRGNATLSPYLAVDCDALTAHMPLVKQLVAARRFIVLIPGVVVCALDELKREVGRAREAIRWLEAQFQRGNRFLRAQRQHERMPLPLIKYPKKKDREAWFFFQVVECCYYFSQQNGVHELTPETCLVTLLTGQPGPLDDPSRAYSPLGVARSAGVNVEHIEAFHAKWKTSSKSHG